MGGKHNSLRSLSVESRSTAFGLLLVIMTLASTTCFPASAQMPSAFPYTLPGSLLVECWYFGVGFSAIEGQQVIVQWSQNLAGVAPVSVDFYIAPLAAVQRIWLCDYGPVYLYWNDGALGTASWVMPSTGEYAAIIMNYSQYPISGTISATRVNGTLSVTPIGPSTVRRRLPICFFPYCVGP